MGLRQNSVGSVFGIVNGSWCEMREGDGAYRCAEGRGFGLAFQR